MKSKYLIGRTDNIGTAAANTYKSSVNAPRHLGLTNMMATQQYLYKDPLTTLAQGIKCPYCNKMWRSNYELESHRVNGSCVR